MATVGNTVQPSFGWAAYGLNVQNQAWITVTMPSPGGDITNLHAYFDVNQSGPATGYLCLWNGVTGALLGSIAVANIPNGSHSAGGQAWWTAALASSIYVASGASISIGLQTAQANGMVWSYDSAGSTGVGTNSTTPGNITNGAASGFGQIGSYADYTPVPNPTISSVSPTHGAWGDLVTINGSGFTHATGITFNGIAASLTIVSDTVITTTIPTGAATGNLTVTNPAGSASINFPVSRFYGFNTSLQMLDLFAYDGSKLQLVTLYAYDGTNLKQVS